MKAFFGRVTAEIISHDVKAGGRETYFLRVAEEKNSKWPAFVRAVLHISDSDVQFDVSKTFLLREGEVVYLWRIVGVSKQEEGVSDRLKACFASLAEPVMEVALVGGASPRNMFYAHDGRAEAVVAPHFKT